MSEQYFLTSERIGFHAWSIDDVDLAMGLWNDSKVSDFIGGPFSTSQARGMLRTERTLQRLHGIQYWPIFLLETGEFIGTCGLRPYQPSERIYEMSIYLTPEQWGNGYATEAAKTVIDYAFAELKAASLFASHHPDNSRGKGLIEKLCFQYAYDEYYDPTGLDHPSYLLTRKDWL